MAGNQLDAETVRENKRLTPSSPAASKTALMANAETNVVTSEMDKLVKTGQVPRGGFQSGQAIVENALTQAAKPAVQKQINAVHDSSWAVASPKIQQQVLSQASQVAGTKGIVWSPSYAKYPGIALAAAKAINNGQINRDQLKTLKAAVEIVDNAHRVLNAQSDITRAHIMSKLSQPQQVAVVNAAFALNDEMKALQAATMTNSGGQSPLLQALGTAGGAVMDGMNWLMNQGQHYGRATIQQMTTLGGKSLFDAWNDTSVGKFDESVVAQLRSDYGDTAVNVVQDITRAEYGGDKEFTMTDVIAKYAGNQEALHVIDQVMLDSERTPQISDLLGKMNASRLDNLGGMVANAVLPSGMEGTSAAWTVVSKGTNIVTLLTLDPTLAAGKAYRGYKALAYGLEAANGIGDLTKVLSNPKSRRFMESLSQDVAKYNGLDDVSAGKLFGEMRIKYGKYLTDDAIRSIAGHAATGDPKTAAYRWMSDMHNFDDLVLGQAARGIRVEDRVVPQMSLIGQQKIRARLAMRDALSFDPKDAAIFDLITGARVTPNDAAAMRSVGVDPKTVSADKLADVLQSPDVQQHLADVYGTTANGLLHRFVTKEPSTATVRARVDRLARKFELVPRGMTVSIDDATDARTIGRWARTTLPKYASNLIEESWVHANQADRRLILNGLFQTIAKAHGIDVEMILPTGERLGDKLLTSGSKMSEQYATTVGQLDTMVFGTELGQYSLRLIRKTLPKLDKVQRDRLNANGARLTEFFTKQRQLDAQIAHLEAQSAERQALIDAGAGLRSDIEAEIADIEAIVAGVKDAKGRTWGEGRTLLQERKSIKNAHETTHYNPAEFGGQQHGLHLFQMADRISIPDFTLIQQYQHRSNLLTKMIGWLIYSDLSTNIVSGWSFLNLAAPRYVERNAAEDWMGHLLSGGSLYGALKGRAASTMYRELWGRKLGKVAEEARDLADENQFFGKLLMQHAPEADVRAFREAMESGDVDVAEGLAGSFVARMIMSPLGRRMDDVDQAAMRAFSTTPAARRLVDHVSEVRGNVNNGRVMSAVDDQVLPQMRADMVDLRKQKPGIYTDIEFTDIDANANLAWSQMLHNILHKDGKPGQIVFNAMVYADKYKGGSMMAARAKYMDKLVAFFKDTDASAQWWQKSSALNEVGPEEFARRYFDAASHYFGHEGYVNRDLVTKLTRKTDTGAKFGALYLKENGAIVDASRFTLDDLAKYGKFERPSTVLGRTMETVGGTDKLDAMERGFAYLGESLARISREPMFFSNYLDEWRAAQPQLKRLIDSGMDEAAAEKIVAEGAMDRAADVTMAYIDNPNVRTQLAFNARNVARYYRATEDFYRRAMRLAVYRPDELQKANLVYQNLNNSGFVYTDDQGTQYFMYPGTGIVNDAIAKAMQILGNGTVPANLNPFVMGGQTLMLTPSLDPNSVMPTFSSPIIAPTVKALTAIGPFQWLEPVLLGSRGTTPTTDMTSFGVEVARSVMPAPILRLLDSFPQTDRDTMLSNATISAMRYAAYAGLYTRKADENNEAFKERVKKQIGFMAQSALIVRFALGFVTPASPQMLTKDDLTDEARQAGAKSLRTEFTALVNKFSGNYDKALATWFAMNPDTMPYTESATEATGQGYPSVTSGAGKWLVQNADWVNKFPSASPFLSPDDGDFSFSTWSLVKALGMVRGKTTQAAMAEIFTQRSYYEYNAVKDYFDAKIANEQSTAVRGQLRDQWAGIKTQMFMKNPLLEGRVGVPKEQAAQSAKKDALLGMRLALQDINANRRDMVNDRTKRLDAMLQTYDLAMDDITRMGGNTDYAIDQRKQMRSRLRGILQAAAAGDRGATDFYDRVLDPLIG